MYCFKQYYYDATEKFQSTFDKLEDEDEVYSGFFGVDSPSSYEWDNVRAFVKSLKYFYDAPKKFLASAKTNFHTFFSLGYNLH